MQKEPSNPKSRRSFAWWVGIVLNPLILPPILFVLLEAGAGAGSGAVWHMALLSTFMYAVLPLGYLIALLRKGTIETIEARNHAKRKTPLLIGVVLLVLAIPVMATVSTYAPETSLLVSSILAINAILIALITTRFKISIHVSGVAGFLSIPLALEATGIISTIPGGFYFYVVALIFIPAVAWARVADDAHSEKQVFWGAVFGLIVPSTEILIASRLI